MGALEYHVTNFPAWIGKVQNLYTGTGGDPKTYADLVAEWGSIMNNAIGLKIWSGAAAKSNYDLFIQVGNDIGKYFTDFEAAYNASMESVNSTMYQLETTNSVNGQDVKVTDSLNLTDEQVSEIEALTSEINEDIIIYNKEEIEALATTISTFVADFQNATANALSIIDEIATGTDDTVNFVWEGTAATDSKAKLKESISKNSENIEADLTAVSDKVKLAATTAKSADTVKES